MPPEIVAVYVTCKNANEADVIGQAVVRERLAACATVVPGAHSFYRWKGKLEHADECVLLLKTRQSLVAKLAKRIKELHSYEVPCIVAMPVVAGDEGYLKWVSDEVA